MDIPLKSFRLINDRVPQNIDESIYTLGKIAFTKRSALGVLDMGDINDNGVLFPVLTQSEIDSLKPTLTADHDRLMLWRLGVSGNPDQFEYYDHSLGKFKSFVGSQTGTVELKGILDTGEVSGIFDDYDPIDIITGRELKDTNFLVVKPTGNTTIKGLVPPYPPVIQQLVIYNGGTSNLSFQKIASTTPSYNLTSNKTLAPDEAIISYYLPLISKWVLIT